MFDVSIGAGVALVVRTYPFLLVRSLVYFGIAAAFTVAASGGAGFGWAVGSIGGGAGRSAGAFWGALGGVAIVILMLWWLREYLLYLVRIGHVAAMVLALDGRAAPAGLGSIGQAIGRVQQCFGRFETLIAAERLARGTLAAIIPISSPAKRVFPSNLALPPALLNPLFRVALGTMTEVVLAHPLRTGAINPWAGTRDALIQFAQSEESIMRGAPMLLAASCGIAVVAFLIALAPASALARTYTSPAGPIGLLLAATFAWSFWQAFIRPFIVAALIQTYFQATKRVRPDAAWEARLTEMSEHFRELKSRASAARGAQRA